MDIEAIHHVSLTVSDLERSREFYRDIFGLMEIQRPAFSFPGAWFQVGDRQQLHLIVHTDPTFRGPKGIDTRDVHFALRVKSHRAAVEALRGHGYSQTAAESDPKYMVARSHPTAGFPQVYILDPDHHIIEINADALD